VFTLQVYWEMDGAAVLKNLDGTTLNYIGKQKAKWEGEFKVFLELDSKACRIWPQADYNFAQADWNKNAWFDWKAWIQDAVDDLQTSDTLVVSVP